ncbi:MAG TPA: hypothetical protein VMH02_02835 [Verrucomicrobiae bacterium]|nr:hypothetical protein [Verrucomicrobiae bacterium]
MSERAIAIRLKIPDNEAYTALVALQRLGVEAERLERSEIWIVEDAGDPSSLASRVEANESVFNPNKHRLEVLASPQPRAGEVWIEELGAHDEVREHLGGKAIDGIARARRCVGWRLLDRYGEPVSRGTVADAADLLLCNPAIEVARLGPEGSRARREEAGDRA